MTQVHEPSMDSRSQDLPFFVSLRDLAKQCLMPEAASGAQPLGAATQLSGVGCSSRGATALTALSLPPELDAIFALVGSKAFNLARLMALDLPVPDGFCVTTAAFKHFIAGCPKYEPLVASLSSLPADDRQAISNASEAIREAMAEAPLPAAVGHEEVRAWTERHQSLAYAVRSSATAEDLAQASFAGQLDTFLAIRRPERLLDRIRACWQSLFSERAISYRQRQAIGHRQVAMAVLVQQMVAADSSGVLFTADPLSGARDRLVIEAVFGLGEALVSGRVNPDRFVVDKTSMRIVQEHLAVKECALVADGEEGVAEISIEGSRMLASSLLPAEITALTQLALKAERAFGAPQDIEWVLSGGVVYLLQARPITVLPGRR